MLWRCKVDSHGHAVNQRLERLDSREVWQVSTITAPHLPAPIVNKFVVLHLLVDNRTCVVQEKDFFHVFPDLVPHAVDASGVGIVVKLFVVELLWREPPSAEIFWYVTVLEVEATVLVPDEGSGLVFVKADYIENNLWNKSNSGSPIEC